MKLLGHDVFTQQEFKVFQENTITSLENRNKSLQQYLEEKLIEQERKIHKLNLIAIFSCSISLGMLFFFITH